MLTLPVYLRAGTYYLHTRIGPHQFKRSLKTANPALARLRALELLRVIEMSKPKLSDFNFNSEELRRYEIELGGVRIKSDGPDDHKRALEAIAALKSVTGAAQNMPPVAVPFEQVPVPSSSSLTVTELLDRYLQMKQL